MPTPELHVSAVHDRSAWDAEVDRLAGHPLQLWGWGEVKAEGAWTPHRLRVERVGPDGRRETVGVAQVLVRRLPMPFRALAHVPRGPAVGDPADRTAVTDAVVAWVRANVGGVGITIEPDWDAADAAPVTGSRPSPNPILFASTLVLDLSQDQDALLADMSRTTRYDIRKGARNGLDVHRVTTEDEVRAVLRVYHETAAHAGFALHDDAYYLAIHRHLGDRSLLVAAFDDEGAPVSFVWDVVSATTAFELYGGVTDAGRRLRANAPVKWGAITASQDLGVRRYDLNGLLNDGISEFKRSFASHTDELAPSVDVPFSALYGAWNELLPRAKQVVRGARAGAARVLRR